MNKVAQKTSSIILLFYASSMTLAENPFYYGLSVLADNQTNTFSVTNETTGVNFFNTGGQRMGFGASLFLGIEKMGKDVFSAAEINLRYTPGTTAGTLLNTTVNVNNLSSAASTSLNFDLGFYPNNSTIAYAILGGALTRFVSSNIFNRPYFKQTRWRFGVYPGVGFRFRLNHFLSLKTEYNFIFYQHLNHSAGGNYFTTKPYENIFSIGLLIKGGVTSP